MRRTARIADMRQAKGDGMNRETICARIGAAIAMLGVAVLALGSALAVGATAIDQFKPVTQDRPLRATENPNDWLIHDGRPGTLMPSWGKQLSSDEIWKVITYLQSLRQGG